MPALKPEHVTRRLVALDSTLSDANPTERLAILAELRYYQSKQLATVDRLVPRYDKILGPGKGHVLANGEPAQRREVVRQWLGSP